MKLKISEDRLLKLQKAVQGRDLVEGYTHNHYRYPARFSPKFVREVIKEFSKPGDLILDPFVGGGTTLVEAMIGDRHSIGFDVSPIATFVTRSKTNVLSEIHRKRLESWSESILKIRIRGKSKVEAFYEKEGYLNNVPPAVKNLVSLIQEKIESLVSQKEKNFATCILLKTAQWSIDCRKTTPTASLFRKKFVHNIKLGLAGAFEFSKAVSNSKVENLKCVCINGSAETISSESELLSFSNKPKLVVTSPPYVGVHMNYHQWQVNSRRRTRAPFWIINALDGHGSAHYTFGHYKSHVKSTYFEIAERVFRSIVGVVDDEAIVVQLVGFSDHKKHLTKYLRMMELAGYEEIFIDNDSLGRAKRLWRTVPHRKWYANTSRNITSGREVMLIHRKKSK